MSATLPNTTSVRTSWFAERATALIEKGGVNADLLRLARVETIETIPDLGPATVVARIYSLYASVTDPDHIVRTLGSSDLLPAGCDERTFLNEVVVPSLQRLRGRDLPFERWWLPGVIYWSLLGVLSRAMRTNGPEEVEHADRQLETRWGLEIPELRRDLIGSTTASWEVEYSYFEREPTSPEEQQVQELACEPAVSTAAEERMPESVPDLAERPDLQNLIRSRIRLRAIRNHLKTEQGWSNDETLQLLTPAVAELQTAHETLTPYERDLVGPRDRKTRLLEDCLLSQRGVHFMDDIVDGLPDLIDGNVVRPQWLQDYIVGANGRLYQDAVGPIPFWCVTFEGPDVSPRLKEPPQGLSIEEEDTGLTISLHFDDGGSTPVVAPLSFPRSPDTTASLALLALVGYSRVDILLLRDGTDLFRVASHGLPLPEEARNRISDIAASELARFDAGRGRDFREAWLKGLLAADAVPGFVMAETAKSERLYLPGGDAELDHATDELLRLRATRAERLARGNWTEQLDPQIEQAELKREETLRRARGRGDVPRPPRTLDDLAELAEAALPPDAAFLHFTFRDGFLDLHALIKTANTSVERLDISYLSADRIADQVRIWASTTSRTNHDLESLLYQFTPQFAGDLERLISDRAIRHLFVSPTWFVHPIPLHAVQVDGERRLGDLVQSFVYASSLADLAVEAEKAGGAGTLAVAWDDGRIPLAPVEARMVAELMDGNEMVGTDATVRKFLKNAQSASLIHLAAHGQWVLGDHWSSQITLADKALSFAELERRGEFKARLAVLSACSSGLALMPAQRLEDYQGLDGAFRARGVRATVSALWEVNDLSALLFMTAFYDGIRNGHSLVRSYSTAVRFLRNGIYLDPPLEYRAILDAVFPSWKREIEQAGESLTEPLNWAVYRLAGWVDPS